MAKVELEEGLLQCRQCDKTKPSVIFVQSKRKIDTYKNICSECEQCNQMRRHQRILKQRDGTLLQEREERRKQDWVRKMVYRQIYEEQCVERKLWYLRQPDRQCRVCKQHLPALAFDGIFQVHDFRLYTQCRVCHERLCEELQLACCYCQQKTSRRDFISQYNGYALSGCGTFVSLCCHTCASVFGELSMAEQRRAIQERCQKALTRGQVIYAEVDPNTDEIRYIGRTSQPKRRHAQHLADASPTPGLWGKEKKEWFRRSNWVQSLADEERAPVMKILQAVETPPLVLEWELRYIWHGIQQGWRLLNVETMDERLVTRIRRSQINFLESPFELLVRQGFFHPYGITAFIRTYY